MRILVFAGTTEAREFVSLACRRGFEVTASVATEYGREVLEESFSLCREEGSLCEVLTGRMDEGGMLSVIPGFDAVVDATHPYAVEVSANVRAACEKLNKPCFRLFRNCSDDSDFFCEIGDSVVEFSSMQEICAALDKTSGNIFISTGSRDVVAFKSVARIGERGFVRVLPTADAIEKCRNAGFLPGHIIAMQGPFSERLNEAMFREVCASVLVTKRSGKNGGYAEKVRAALSCGMKVFVLLCPDSASGGVYTDYEELLSALGRLRGGA